MREMSENQGSPGTMSDYFSPKGKVEDYLGCPLQQCSPSKLTYFQETPMKPSQVQNRLSSLSLPKKMSLLQSSKALPPPNRTRDSLSSLNVAKPVAHFQNNVFREQKQTAQPASSVKLHPAGNNCLFLKRCMDSERSDSNLKKKCLQNTSSGTIQTSNCSASQSQHLSAVSSSSSSDFFRLELSPKSTHNILTTEPAFYRPVRLTMPPKLSPKAPPDSPSKHNILSRLPGVRKACMVKITEDYVHLQSPNKSLKHGSLHSQVYSSRKGVRSSDQELSLENGGTTVQDSKDSGSSTNGPLASHQPYHSQCSKPAAQVKLPSKDGKSGESTAKEIGDACKTHKQAAKPKTTGPLRSHTGQKKSCIRRLSAIPDDISDLFTPDPLTYVSSSKHKEVVRPAAEQVKAGPHTTEADGVPDSAATSRTPKAESPSRQKKHSTGTNIPHLTASVTVKDAKYTPIPKLSPIVRLARLNMNILWGSTPDSGLKIPVSLPIEQPNKYDSEPAEVHKTPLNPENGTPTEGDASCAADGTTSKDPLTSTLPASKEDADRGGKMVDEDALGLDLGFGLDLDESESSESSEDEDLIFLQEMMQRVAKPPEKRAYTEPTTSISSRRNTIPNTTLQSTATALNCRNNLDQMLKEIRCIKRSKEKEKKLLSTCKEEDLRKAEPEENHDETISSEQEEFLRRFPVMSSAIRDVHPGEVVFNLESSGRLFSQHTLQLRHCKANPQGIAQKTLLWSSPAQLSLHIRSGLFQDAYDYSPCPPQVTRFLFKMMSVHTERMISDKILQALCDIARSAANHIVNNGNQKFEVWVPSVADVTVVLLNMGASFVTLFPLENFQPPFNEGDLLEDMDIKSESPSSNLKLSTFPKHNYSNVLKYLSYCMALCPRAFSDPELLLLLTLGSRLGLEARFTLEPHIDLRCLQRHIIRNVRDWEDMLPRMCVALTELTADHHNMCCLVQLLPDHPRGNQLRRHLSVGMISKLLDGSCTYKPSGKEFELSYLQPYMPRIKPTSLRSMLSPCSVTKKEGEENMYTLDQQTYYLCYSLLTLVNQASNFLFFPPHQKEQLMMLCTELDRHIKRDMKENDKCLYRSKVNDLVARIYTKWWMLIQRNTPRHDKLYNVWQPSPQDMLSSGATTEETLKEEGGDATDNPGVSSGEEDEMDQDMDEEGNTGHAMEDDEEPEQMNAPARGEPLSAVVMEPS